jgi:hypothetical protein
VKPLSRLRLGFLRAGADDLKKARAGSEFHKEIVAEELSEIRILVE